MNPPIAKKIAHEDNTHNDLRIDNYHWLRNKESQEVIDYLKAENAYTESVTAHTKDLQKTLYDEFISRINETDLSVPVKIKDYYYYSRTEEGKNYSIHCRKKGSLDAAEEVLLDGNELAEGKEYFNLGTYALSTNHQLMAYSVDFNGSEKYDIYVKDLTTGELLSDKISETSGRIVWANNNQTFYYTTLDETQRPYRLHRHDLGQVNDKVVFEELDGRFFLYPYKSKSKEYIFVVLGSKVTTEMHFMDAHKADDAFQVIHPKQHKMEYDVAHHGDDFYILTNENAQNFKLMKTKVATPAKENWVELLPHDENVLLSSVEAFKNHLVIYGRKNGFKCIFITNLTTNEHHEIVFPEPVYIYWESNNPDFETTKLRFTYSSLITPRTVYDYGMSDRSWDLKKEYKVKGGYDKSEYATERLWATATDGTKIPMSIAYKKGLTKNGANPTYLYGYGSYGASMDPYFSTLRLSLLDRGFIYVMAHIRGGSEMGRQWYESGKFLHKKNTFTDFIACAEHLIQEKYTSNQHLVMAGGSAGGLLMGAVMNMRPDLFKLVVAHVPFVDVINTMLDESIPLTVVEFDEWGNPKDKVYYDYMKSYSPYDNIEAKPYPNLLITAGLNDPRVQYWEPAKWTAKLRDMKTDDNLLMLKVNMDAGHGGASGRYEAYKEYAFEYAVILDVVSG